MFRNIRFLGTRADLVCSFNQEQGNGAIAAIGALTDLGSSGQAATLAGGSIQFLLAAANPCGSKSFRSTLHHVLASNPKQNSLRPIRSSLNSEPATELSQLLEDLSPLNKISTPSSSRSHQSVRTLLFQPRPLSVVLFPSSIRLLVERRSRTPTPTKVSLLHFLLMD